MPEGLDAIVLASAPLSEGLSPAAFLRNLLELGAVEGAEPAIRVFLAPHLPASHREEALRKFRSGAIPAAVIDDVDACRLLLADGIPEHGLDSMLHFVAIVSEQLSGAAGQA